MGKPKFQVLVITVSLFFAVLNSIAFFRGVAMTPAGTDYLGTVHYWEDYFFYLNHFFQGANGAWLTVNRFTPEATPPTIIYWANVMMGKIFSIFGLPPVLSYNLCLLILTFSALVASYYLLLSILHRHNLAFIGFILSATATSLQNRVLSSEGKMIFWPFQIWKTPHFAFDRLGGAPHQTLLTLLVSVFLIIYLQKLPRRPLGHLVILTVMIIAITSIQLAQGAMTVILLFAAEMISSLISRRLDRDRIQKLLFITPITAICAYYMYRLFDLSPHVQTKLWEATQHSYTTLPFLLKSIGPVVILATAGILANIRKFRSIHWYGLMMIACGYLMFMSRIPQKIGISNVRLLFPSTYVFWGLFGALGIESLSALFTKRLKLNFSRSIVVITIIYLILTVPTLIWEIGSKLKNSGENNSPLVYLPKEISEGFNILKKTGSFDDVVVGGSASRMDTLIPALSGHTAYSGHLLQTTDNAGKQAVVARFFKLQLDSATALSWLQKEKVNYVFFTNLDGNRSLFGSIYPFLQKIWENTSVIIYRVPG
jgi:hypothetical protein